MTLFLLLRDVFPETGCIGIGKFSTIYWSDGNFNSLKVTDYRHSANILIISFKSGMSQMIRLAFDLLTSTLNYLVPVKAALMLRQVLPPAKCMKRLASLRLLYYLSLS